MALWVVQLLGVVRVVRDEHVVDRFGSRKHAALLGLLAFRPGRSHSRELLIEALWPGVEPGAGRNRLSVGLNALRRVLEPPDVARGAVLVADRSSVALAADVVDVDVMRVEAALARARSVEGPAQIAALADAVDAYRGPLLPEHEEDWIAAEAAGLERRVLDAALSLSDHLLAIGDVARARDVLVRATTVAPLQEAAHVRLLHLYAESGQLDAGLDHARALQQLVSTATGRLPGPQVRAAVERLTGGRARVAMSVVASVVHAPGSVRLHLVGAGPWEVRLEGGAGRVIHAGVDRATVALETVVEALAMVGVLLVQDDRVQAAIDVLTGGQGAADDVGARLVDLVSPGGVLLSDVARAVAARADVAGLVDLGVRDVAGRAERVTAWVGADGEVPQVRSRPVRATRLPATVDRFFGRQDELADLASAWREGVRLQTLLGAGGSGKTRLALELAGWLLDSPDGPAEAALVALESLGPGDRLDAALANALGLPDAGGSVAPALVALFDGRPGLLVIDNAEHLVDHVAPWVSGLLRAVPSLSVVVTSQRALRVDGERRVPLAPLPVPSASLSLAELAVHPTVAMFLERARAARADVALTRSNAEDLCTLIARLEGLPLALELVASRAGSLSVRQMLARLSDTPEAPAPARRDKPARHQSLLAAIAWNTDLLPADVRAFWEVLSVFPAPFDVEAAEVVCEAPMASDWLIELQEASLIIRVQGGDGIAWRLADGVRMAADQALDATRREALAARYHSWLAELLLALNPQLEGPGFRAALTRMHALWPHVGHVVRQAPVDLAAAVLRSTYAVAVSASRELEYVSVALQLLARDPEPTRHVVDAVRFALGAAGRQGDPESEAPFRAWLAEHAADGRGEVELAGAMHDRGELEAAERWYAEAEQRYADSGRPGSAAVMRDNRAHVALARGRRQEALDHGDVALAVFDGTGHHARILACRLYRAILYLWSDDPDGCDAELARADHAIPEGEDPPWWRASDISRAHARLLRGDVDGATTMLDAVEPVFQSLGNVRYMAFLAQLRAWIHLSQHRYTEARREARVALDRFRSFAFRLEVPHCEVILARACAALGEGSEAQAAAERALKLQREHDATLGLPAILVAWAAARLAQGATEDAAWALAAAHDQQVHGWPIPRWDRAAVDELQRAAGRPVSEPTKDWRAVVDALLAPSSPTHHTL